MSQRYRSDCGVRMFRIKESEKKVLMTTRFVCCEIFDRVFTVGGLRAVNCKSDNEDHC